MTDVADEIEPRSCSLDAHRVRLHYWDYGGRGPIVILVHGLFDHARSWDRVAGVLRQGWHVHAVDLRGHGDGPRVPGAAYSLHEHVLDIAALVRSVARGNSVRFLAHSLGSLVALRYAAAFPEFAAAVVAIEGISPPPAVQARAQGESARLREWILSVQRLEGQPPAVLESEEDALNRLRRTSPALEAEWGRHLVRHGTNLAPGGRLVWKHDPYLQGRLTPAFDIDRDGEVYALVTCPVLVLQGRDSWGGDEVTGRLARVRRLQVIDVPGAGHWVHHDQPALVAQEAARFFRHSLPSAVHDGLTDVPAAAATTKEKS